jgi:CBS domain-containing protein
MRERGLPCLPVVDSNLQVVGVVRMRDLMRGDENRP